jgi:hypothetical protein
LLLARKLPSQGLTVIVYLCHKWSHLSSRTITYDSMWPVWVESSLNRFL